MSERTKQNSTRRAHILRLLIPMVAAALPLAFLPGCKKAAVPETLVTVQAEHPEQGPIAEQITADAILAPIAAMLVQMAISRTREFEADREGAEISGRPLWLASALQKIETAASVTDNPQADANPATAHMFIVNPLHGGGWSGLFASHPSTEERIARLRAMAGQTDAQPAGPWA